jgi:UDP-N-acetylmuramoyl-L-alanyl-D-glutamate--2,6-diaminopimelate ligase
LDYPVVSQCVGCFLSQNKYSRIHTSMQLNDVLAGVVFSRRGGFDPTIAGIEYDSRQARPGSLFVAMKGESTDGNRFVEAAIANGAVAIATDSSETFTRLNAQQGSIAVVEVQHGRTALAAISSNFYGKPEKKLKLIGVTGTNGKTTTAFLTNAMLNSVRRKTVLVGTIEYHVCGEVRSSPHTTPESRDLFELMADGVTCGAEEMVMEVSSHALDQERVAGLDFDVAIFTNLTRDHLDYHGTMERYFEAKRRLFDGKEMAAPRVSVINAEDPYGHSLLQVSRAAGALTWSYGLEQGNFRAEQVQMSASGMKFSLRTPDGIVPIQTKLTGRVNVYNLLAASAAAVARGLSLDEIVNGIATLPCVPGRFQTVDCGQLFTVVVDYAHTDDALRNLLVLAREFVAPQKGRIITLFGCGGDRDRTKRPLMGKAAGQGSDFVVLTSDNPRSEEPSAIIQDVLPGLEPTGTPFVTEPDRAAAIRMALQEAHAGDIVLLAGKGHEKVQVLADRTIPFDDVAESAAALAELGFQREREHES